MQSPGVVFNSFRTALGYLAMPTAALQVGFPIARSTDGEFQPGILHASEFARSVEVATSLTKLRIGAHDIFRWSKRDGHGLQCNHDLNSDTAGDSPSGLRDWRMKLGHSVPFKDMDATTVTSARFDGSVQSVTFPQGSPVTLMFDKGRLITPTPASGASVRRVHHTLDIRFGPHEIPSVELVESAEGFAWTKKTSISLVTEHKDYPAMIFTLSGRAALLKDKFDFDPADNSERAMRGLAVMFFERTGLSGYKIADYDERDGIADHTATPKFTLRAEQKMGYFHPFRFSAYKASAFFDPTPLEWGVEITFLLTRARLEDQSDRMLQLVQSFLA